MGQHGQFGQSQGKATGSAVAASCLILADSQSVKFNRILQTSCLDCLDCTVQAVQAGGLENAVDLYRPKISQ